jgi:hypothetical protein
MKTIIILFCLFINAACFAQTAVTDTIAFDPNIIVSLMGNKNTLRQSELDSGICIQAKDPTIKIVQFSLGYAIDIGDNPGYTERIFTGNKGFIDKNHPDPSYEPSIGCGRIFIDKILVERNGKIYYAKAFIIPVQMPARTLKELRPGSLRNKFNGFTKADI